MRDVDLHREVLEVTTSVLAHFLRSVERGVAPMVDARLGMAELGRRRMEMGGLARQNAPHLPHQCPGLFGALFEGVQPGEEAALGHIGSQWFDYLDQASSSAAIAYLRAPHDQVAQIEARTRALVEALLAVDGPAEAAAVAADFSVQLADFYFPYCLPMSAWRETVAATTPLGTLLTSRGEVLLVLVPSAHDRAAWLPSRPDGGVGSRGHAGQLAAELRAEVARAEVLLSVAVVQRATGLIGPGDVLLHQLLVAAPAIAAQVRRQVLEPLLEHHREGLLQRTLKTYFASGSLAMAAKRCVTHSNTVT